MGKRSFIGIMFQCCQAYGRAYLKPDGSAYEAKCPRCYRPVQVRVSKHGTSSRFFSAG